MTPLPGRRELPDHPEDLVLGADVDAGRRLVQDEDLGSVPSHLAMTTFCWLPPERSRTGRPDARVLMASESTYESTTSVAGAGHRRGPAG